jgi:4'-phosphopantetheinyl transferase
VNDGLKTLRDGDVHVWLTRPETVADDVLESYVPLMTRDEAERWQRFRFERDKRLHLVARALVRTTLSRYEDVAPGAWRFEAGEHGRPSIRVPNSLLFFNLTHTAGLVAVAVATEPEVGLDVEGVSPERVSPELCKRVFSPDEVSELNRLPASEQPGRFFDLWTLKESYIKARGLGLAVPLRSFGFHLPPGEAPSIRIAADLRDDPSTWAFQQWAPTSEHALAVALRRRPGEPPLRVTAHETIPTLLSRQTQRTR